MFVRVHCSAEKSEKSILRHLFSEEAPNPAPPLEEGPIFESPKQKTGTEKAYPYKHFFRHRRRTNIYRRPVLRPTRTNICRVSWAKHFAGQTFFSGRRGPAPRRRARSSGCLYVECLYGSAPRGGGAMLGPRNVCTGRVHPTRTNICTQIRSTRPVQTF